MKLSYLFAFLCCCSVFQLHAQLHYGFKTGLNFAHFDGPSETDQAGKSLESWKNVTGFHIGISFSRPFTDNFGLRGELLYSKRGAKYTYDGQSYRFFNLPTGAASPSTSRYLVSINNSYIDLPVMAYGRLGKLEISGGPYVGLLVQSVGDGALVYNDASNDNLEFNLRYNYRRDDPGGSELNGEQVIAQVDGRQVELPKIIGAYYDYPEDRGALYKTLDYGLVGGLSYYFSRALYIGGRFQYGLADITNERTDVSRSTLDGTNRLYRNDKDRNWVAQISVGFGF